MDCPRCGSPTFTKKTRPSSGKVRRRRDCSSCGHRFHTIEAREDDDTVFRVRIRRLLNEVGLTLAEMEALADTSTHET